MKFDLKIFAILAACTSLLVRPASAVLNTLDNASAVNPSNIQGHVPECSEICPKLVQGQQGDGQGLNETKGDASVVGLNGGPWNSPGDDKECAARGFATDVTITSGGTTPTPIASSSTCNVPTLGNESCTVANEKAIKCMFHGSQLEDQCMAWTAASDGNKWDTVLFAMDLATVTACTTACFAKAASGFGEAVETACKYSSFVAGGFEAACSAIMDNGPITKTIHGLLGGAGMAVGTLGAGTTPGGGATIAGNKQIVGSESSGANDTVQDKEACISAALFAVMAGIRVYDMTQMGNTRDSACKAVKGLWSKAAGGNGGGNISSNPAQSFFNPQTGQVTSGGPGATAGGSGGLNNSNTGANQCNGQPCPTIPNTLGSSSAATDAGMLNKTGLDKNLGPLAQKLLDNGLGDAVKQGAGAALSGALGGAGGDFGSGLAHLAQEAQAHGGEFQGANIGGGYAGGGGGGGGGRSEAGNPFANLFGAQGAAASRGPATESYGKPGGPSDIWHTGTTMNIFEIVSGKVAQVTGRVGTR